MPARLVGMATDPHDPNPEVQVDERAKWNRRYRDDIGPHRAPSALAAAIDRLPRAGRALEVAGGSGGAALALARHGLEVTLVDVSDVAVGQALAAAEADGFSLTAMQRDLRNEALPEGPWDVICCFHYLDRELFPAMVAALAPGGWLVVAIATVTNLERHQRPPRRFLVERGELEQLASPLTVVESTEEWTADGIHEARLVARKPASPTE